MKLKLKRHTNTGRLIVFEGTDGAGKSTLIDKTVRHLHEAIGWGKVLVVKQPTDLSRKTRLFQKMMYCRNHEEIDYRAVQLLSLSDRIQHQHEVIVPALKAGKTVICDRYIYTSVANMESRGYLKERWFYEAAKHILQPDLCILAYADPALAIARITARPEEARRHLDEVLLRRVSEYFLRHAAGYRMCVVHTDRAPEEAFADVRERLDVLYRGE